VIRRTHKGGVIFSSKFNPTKEFESLLRRMEELQVFGVNSCDESEINEHLSTISRNPKYMVDILREIFKDNYNRDKIVDVLMQLGLLYLKTTKEKWIFKSDSLFRDTKQTNMKYACCMNIGKIIGERINVENQVMEAKLLQNKDQTEALLKEIKDKQYIEMQKASKVTNVTEKTSLEDEILRLQKLQVDILHKKVCIDESIKQLNMSGFIDINTLSSYLSETAGCEDLLQLLLIKPIASEGGSRRRVRNTHRRGKHTRIYKPKK
jgi:hypothetical protein